MQISDVPFTSQVVADAKKVTVWYGILGFTSHSTQYRSFWRRGGALSSDVHLTFSNGGPAT